MKQDICFLNFAIIFLVIMLACKKNSIIPTPTATDSVITFAGNGTAGDKDGPGSTAEFNGPSGIDIDSHGNLYVTDEKNNSVRMITSAGVVKTVAGTGVAGYGDGPSLTAEFNNSRTLTFDSLGNIYVADYYNNVIRKIILI
jgi:hypothetical protein